MRICGQCGASFAEPVQFCPNDGSPTYEAHSAERRPEDPLIGRVIDGRYRIEQQIGEGGMGVVYLATHTVLSKRLALKVLRGDNSRDADVVQRFMQEAQAATSIGHQNIIDISDFGRLPDGSVYFVMEYLDGTSLADMIKRGGSVPMADAIHLVRQIASALDAAHARGIVHRDLKPDNVFVVRQGGDPLFVKVLDFGVAKVGGAASKLTKTGMVFGTPHYMSPEQAAGHSVDARTDIYALGVIMYEMFTGKVPFDADTFMGILSKHMFEVPTRPSDVKGVALGPLETVILRSLEKAPDDRYASMTHLIADLDTIAAGGSVAAVAVGGRPGVPPPGNLADALEPASRRDLVRTAEESSSSGLGALAIAALAVVALVVVGGGVGTAVFLLTGDAEPEVALTEPAPEPATGPAAQPPTPPLAAPPSVAQPTAVAPTAPTTVAAAAPSPRMIQIVTVPPGAEVLLDGVMVGNTPVAVPRPEEGTQPLTLRLRGHRELSVNISARSGDELSLTLEAEPEVTARVGNLPRVRPQPTLPTQPVVRPITPVVSSPPPPVRRTTSEVVDPWAN